MVKGLKDRQLMKWAPFIMPEQKALLNKAEVDIQKREKPILDDYEILEINNVIVTSFQDQATIKLDLWKDGFIECLGPVVVIKIDPVYRKMYVKNQINTEFVAFDSVVGAAVI